MLGSLQFVSLIVLEKSLGASSFYSSFVAIPFCTEYLKQRFTYMAKFRAGLQNWLALAFTIGSILGAFASAYPSGVYNAAQGVHPYSALLGGFVMVFGARIGLYFFILFSFYSAFWNLILYFKFFFSQLVDVRVVMV